jgi:hypothetical protein
MERNASSSASTATWICNRFPLVHATVVFGGVVFAWLARGTEFYALVPEAQRAWLVLLVSWPAWIPFCLLVGRPQFAASARALALPAFIWLLIAIPVALFIFIFSMRI